MVKGGSKDCKGLYENDFLTYEDLSFDDLGYKDHEGDGAEDQRNMVMLRFYNEQYKQFRVPMVWHTHSHCPELYAGIR